LVKEKVKELKITIKVPEKRSGVYSVSFGSKPKNRKSAGMVYRWVERKLLKLSHSLASLLRYKTVVCIRDGTGCLNEAEGQDARSLLFALACFMEDWLPKNTFEKKFKKYGEQVRG